MCIRPKTNSRHLCHLLKRKMKESEPYQVCKALILKGTSPRKTFRLNLMQRILLIFTSGTRKSTRSFSHKELEDEMSRIKMIWSLLTDVPAPKRSNQPPLSNLSFQRPSSNRSLNRSDGKVRRQSNQLQLWKTSASVTLTRSNSHQDT